MSVSTLQRISTEEIGGVTVVTFRDQKIIEEEKIDELGTELYAIGEEQALAKIVLDFGEVTLRSRVIVQRR